MSNQSEKKRRRNKMNNLLYFSNFQRVLFVSPVIHTIILCGMLGNLFNLNNLIYRLEAFYIYCYNFPLKYVHETKKKKESF